MIKKQNNNQNVPTHCIYIEENLDYSKGSSDDVLPNGETMSEFLSKSEDDIIAHYLEVTKEETIYD